MQYLLLHFGYAFLILGLIIEGDATLVAAMILASQSGQQYLDLRWVLGLALGVTVGGNELLYELGALGWFGNRFNSSRHYRRTARWLHQSRSGYLALLFSRFMWGFRLMIPVAAGLLHIRRRRFSISNLIGGVIWVGVLAYFGVAVESLLELVHNDFIRYQSHIAVSLFLLGLLIGLGSIPWQIVRRSLRQAAPASVVPRITRRALHPGSPAGASGSGELKPRRAAESSAKKSPGHEGQWPPHSSGGAAGTNRELKRPLVP